MNKVLVLGGGPAGYVAALRAAQLGAAVTLVEEREIGGTCLNRGCIPTKALVAAAERLRQARTAAAFGVLTADVGVDFAAVMQRKTDVTAELRAGVEHLLQARKVDVVRARGLLVGAGELALDDGRALYGDAIILATGSEPARPSLFDFSDPRMLTSDELLALTALPASIVIVGGGVIGCEFASIFAELGTAVTVVEMMDRLLPEEDTRAGRTLQQAFKKSGITVLLGDAVTEVGTSSPGAVSVRLAGGAEATGDVVLVAIGRRPLSRDLGYEETGVEIDAGGFVVTDETLRTSVDGVFAAGDIAGPPMLAHWAYHEGAVAAANAVSGGRLAVDRGTVPNCIFSHPEVASVGLTEDRAAAAGANVVVASVRFNGNSKAVIEGESDGFVRIVADAGSGAILGATLVGPKVTELVHELALAIRNGLTLDAVATTIHAHPTLSEAIGEAALSGRGRGIHSL
jgi:dihydrolipoamide dehydrogenase